MYESITSLLPDLKSLFPNVSDNSTTQSFQEDSIYHSQTIDQLFTVIYQFIEEHPEFELTRYNQILKENHITGSEISHKDIDVSSMDGQVVMAIIVGATRMDHFTNGYILNYFEDGSLVRWIERLKELDSQP